MPCSRIYDSDFGKISEILRKSDVHKYCISRKSCVLLCHVFSLSGMFMIHAQIIFLTQIHFFGLRHDRPSRRPFSKCATQTIEGIKSRSAQVDACLNKINALNNAIHYRWPWLLRAQADAAKVWTGLCALCVSNACVHVPVLAWCEREHSTGRLSHAQYVPFFSI